MNKGALRGFRGSTQRRRPWTYVPLRSYIDAFNSTTIAADDVASITTGVFRSNAVFNDVPRDGRIVAARVKLFARNSTAVSISLTVHDWNEGNVNFAASMNQFAYGGHACYGGTVAAHYNEIETVVTTGGIDDLQIKYSIDWTSGTGIAIIRIIGVYIEGIGG